MTDSKKRQSIPVTSRKVLRPEAKLSLRQRAKNALKNAVGAVKSAAKKVFAKTKAVAKVAWSKTATAWRKALRPFLKTFGALVAGVIWVSTLVVAPLGTVAVTAGAGVLLIGLARLLEALDGSNKRIAKLAIQAIETIAQALRVAFYLWSAAIAIVTLPAWGPMAAVLGVTLLILNALPRSEMLYEMPTQAPVDVDLETPAATRRQKIDIIDAEVEPTSAVDKPKAIRAIGAEEMRDMNACDACGTIEGSLRAKSHRRAGDNAPEAWLCGECYDLECEDDAIRFTGVSLKKTSVEVRLNKEGLATTREHAASLVDDNVHWAPTAWWRDKSSALHEREWSGYVRGEVVANVIFDYRRGTYRMLVMGKPPRDVGAQRDRQAAQRLATDIWNDAVLRLEHEMQEAAEPVQRRAIKAV